MRVRKSRRCTGGLGKDGSADVSISTFAKSWFKLMILLFFKFSVVEFMSPLKIWDKKLVEQIWTKTVDMTRMWRIWRIWKMKLKVILWGTGIWEEIIVELKISPPWPWQLYGMNSSNTWGWLEPVPSIQLYKGDQRIGPLTFRISSAFHGNKASHTVQNFNFSLQFSLTKVFQPRLDMFCLIIMNV